MAGGSQPCDGHRPRERIWTRTRQKAEKENEMSRIRTLMLLATLGAPSPVVSSQFRRPVEAACRGPMAGRPHWVRPRHRVFSLSRQSGKKGRTTQSIRERRHGSHPCYQQTKSPNSVSMATVISGCHPNASPNRFFPVRLNWLAPISRKPVMFPCRSQRHSPRNSSGNAESR